MPSTLPLSAFLAVDLGFGLRAGIDRARHLGTRIAGIGVQSWGVHYGRLTVDGSLRPFVRHHRDVDANLAVASGHFPDLDAARQTPVDDGDQPIRRYEPASLLVDIPTIPAEGHP